MQAANVSPALLDVLGDDGGDDGLGVLLDLRSRLGEVANLDRGVG